MLHTICTHARTHVYRQAGRQTDTHDKTRTRTICTDTRVHVQEGSKDILFLQRGVSLGVRMMAGAFDLMCVDVPEEPMVTIVNTVS